MWPSTRHGGAAGILNRSSLEDIICFVTCMVNCNSLLAIDSATYLAMRFCRRDGASSPVVCLAAYLFSCSSKQRSSLLMYLHVYNIYIYTYICVK